MKSDIKEIWIFLSHSNEDYEKVRRVRNILEDMNMRPLMFFLKCLNDNDEIEDLIKREIKARTRFILCDSENARNSNWVTKEIEYIRELNKPYDVIDISEEESQIRKQLKNCFRREHIFISYPRDLLPAINVVHARLSKYDFCTSFIDKSDLSPGTLFEEVIKKNIMRAVEKGNFISILSHHSLQGRRYSQYELEQAREFDIEHKAILPIYLDEASKLHYNDFLSDYDYIDLSKSVTPHEGLPNAKDIPYRHGMLGSNTDLKLLGNDIVNAILVRLQGWGNIETYAENFRYGRGLPKDVMEADELAQLIVEHLEAIDCGEHFHGPGMLLRLGNLYKENRVINQDYAKAREYYESARIEWGIAVDGMLAELPNR